MLRQAWPPAHQGHGSQGKVVSGVHGHHVEFAPHQDNPQKAGLGLKSHLPASHNQVLPGAPFLSHRLCAASSLLSPLFIRRGLRRMLKGRTRGPKGTEKGRSSFRVLPSSLECRLLISSVPFHPLCPGTKLLVHQTTWKMSWGLAQSQAEMRGPGVRWDQGVLGQVSGAGGEVILCNSTDGDSCRLCSQKSCGLGLNSMWRGAEVTGMMVLRNRCGIPQMLRESCFSGWLVCKYEDEDASRVEWERISRE